MYSFIHVLSCTKAYINTYINEYITLYCITLYYITLHYITLHYITVHYITLHYATLRYITLHYITMHYNTLHYNTIGYITLQYNTIHYIALHYTPLQYNRIHYITVRYRHYIALHCIALHYIALHRIQVQYITLHYIALHYSALHYITFHCINTASQAYIQPFRHTYSHSGIHIAIQAYVHACKHVPCMHTWICVSIHMYMSVYIYMHNTYIYIDIHIYAYVCAYGSYALFRLLPRLVQTTNPYTRSKRQCWHAGDATTSWPELRTSSSVSTCQQIPLPSSLCSVPQKLIGTQPKQRDVVCSECAQFSTEAVPAYLAPSNNGAAPHKVPSNHGYYRVPRNPALITTTYPYLFSCSLPLGQ